MGFRFGEDMDRVRAYVKSLPTFEQQSREEERKLAERAQRGDATAREELVKRYLGFVVAIARRYAGRGARLEDLIQEGNYGLLKAVDKFDTNRGTRFSTYAVWWIKAYIQKQLLECHSAVRGGEESSRRGVRDLSLDAPLDETSEPTYLERIVDERPGPEDSLLSNETRAEVHRYLRHARPRLKPMADCIVRERFLADEPKTLEQIGQRFGVSRERVRQVEVKTRAVLREELSTLAPNLALRSSARDATNPASCRACM